MAVADNGVPSGQSKRQKIDHDRGQALLDNDAADAPLSSQVRALKEEWKWNYLRRDQISDGYLQHFCILFWTTILHKSQTQAIAYVWDNDARCTLTCQWASLCVQQTEDCKRSGALTKKPTSKLVKWKKMARQQLQASGNMRLRSLLKQLLITAELSDSKEAREECSRKLSNSSQFQVQNDYIKLSSKPWALGLKC